MSIIKALSPDVISMISAGEVIERPANVIKELIENSLDGGASAIRIEIEDSGFDKISVFDNGVGMDKADLELCALPHTTSKLARSTDMQSVKTLGFRGEALSSIFSVSAGVIYSKPKAQKYGYRLDISYGEVLSVVPESMKDGTVVIVNNLFHNIPARKEFLHNKRYEYTQIVEIVSVLALSRPDIAFSLVSNSKEVLLLPRGQSFDQRIQSILTAAFFTNLVPISFTGDGFSVSGYISKPLCTFKSTKKQFLFINNRAVSPSMLSASIRDFYGNLIEYRMHPAFLLHLECQSNRLDVNVHPKKEAVRIKHFDQLLPKLKESVIQSLQKHDLTYIKEGFTSLSTMLVRDAGVDYKAGVSTKQTLFEDATRQYLQIHNMYIVVETQQGILLIDQHAAHERIVYEELLNRFNNHILEQDCITTSEVIELSLTDLQTLLSHKAFFATIGIFFEEFGSNMIKLVSIPRIYEGRNISAILLGFLEDMASEEGLSLTTLADERTKKALSYLACRSAIKSGKKLSDAEITSLMSVLELTAFDYTCPHGRPIKLELTLPEINRLFKRT